SMMPPRTTWLSLALALCAPAALRADPPVAYAPGSPPVSYYQQVRPIFQAHCQGCHQPAKARGEFVMTAFDKLLAGGESGQNAVVPHHPDQSKLVADLPPVAGNA